MENYSYSSYPDSGDSSPRGSRDIDFESPPPWEVVDNNSSSNSQSSNYKVKFMCSYGGKILPRPHDNQLSYVGGETKILAVDRSTKFAAVVSKLSALAEHDVSFKYQLPGEDLDALISVTNDDDLEHMMHEHDRLYRASARPARMRLFLFNSNPNGGGFGPDGGRSDKDRFVEALNSGPALPPDPIPKPSVPNNVDYFYGLEKGGVTPVVSPPPPPAPTVPETVAPPPEYQVRPGQVDRVTGSDPVEFRRQLQSLQIGEQDQQAMYRKKNDDNLVGGYGGAGDHYVQKLPEMGPRVTMSPPVGYWPENQVASGGFPVTGTPDQQMYMVTSTAGGGTMYHSPPMVRPVTGPAGQGYYVQQQQQPRVGSEVYREQPVFSALPQQQQQRMGSEVYREHPVFSALPQQQPPSSTLPPQPPKYVATYPEMSPYTQVPYDSTTGRQVYYTAPGGVMQQQQQAYQAVGPTAVGGEMRVAVGLGPEAKVVGSKIT